MPKIDQSVLVKVGQLENEPLPFICIGVQAAPGQYAVMVNPEFSLIQLGEKIPDEAFFKITFDDLKTLHKRIGDILGSTVVLAEENPAQQGTSSELSQENVEPQSLEDRVAFLERCVYQLMHEEVQPVFNDYKETVQMNREVPDPLVYDDDDEEQEEESTEEPEELDMSTLTSEEKKVAVILTEVEDLVKPMLKGIRDQLAGSKKTGVVARKASVELGKKLADLRAYSVSLDKSR